jgi:hypothetical protein
MFAFIKLKNMEHAWTSLSEVSMLHFNILNGDAWGAHGQMGHKGDSGEGGRAIISIQVRCRVRQGATCEGKNNSNEPHRIAWGVMGSWGSCIIMEKHSWMFGFTKLKNLEHPWASLSETETTLHGHMSSHAW